MPLSKQVKAVVAAFAMGALSVAAHEAYAAPRSEKAITDARVREALTFALKNIHHGLCANNSSCAPATEGELRNPPVSIELARDAMTIGTVSGVAQRCGFDWQGKFFAPMMKRFRHQVQLNQRQLALIAILHGMQQSLAYKSAGDDICTSEMKRILSRSAAR